MPNPGSEIAVCSLGGNTTFWKPFAGAGLMSTALVLSIALPFGGQNWYWLAALSPLAGGYYWQRGTRQEDFKVTLLISPNFSKCCPYGQAWELLALWADAGKAAGGPSNASFLNNEPIFCRSTIWCLLTFSSEFRELYKWQSSFVYRWRW